VIDKYGVGQDPYCYPGTHTLKNLLDIKEEALLESAEREITEIEAQRLTMLPPPYDYSYLKLIHKSLFSDIYEWAGKQKTVDISKNDTRFCTVDRVESEADKLFNQLNKKNHFENLSKDQLIVAAAQFYSDLNALHPFRDGNGRTQRILFEHIIFNCGFFVSWEGISQDEWLEANIEGFLGYDQKLERVFSKCIGLRIPVKAATDSV
jgi:cell filamentation protein